VSRLVLAFPPVATQNYSAILRPLQWLVIALIFLFFLRVIRAVWVEVRPAGPRQTRSERRSQNRPDAPPRSSKRGKQLHLEVVEPPEHQGQTFDLDDELTVGRSPGCGVPTTYDVFSSTLHARIFRRGDQVLVEDLGSTNGTFVNSERISVPTRLAKGDLLQIGATVFEVSR
jgi:pSer/pThr/pTyr-binding forkhead associated (FHA) protein